MKRKSKTKMNFYCSSQHNTTSEKREPAKCTSYRIHSIRYQVIVIIIIIVFYKFTQSGPQVMHSMLRECGPGEGGRVASQLVMCITL